MCIARLNEYTVQFFIALIYSFLFLADLLTNDTVNTTVVGEGSVLNIYNVDALLHGGTYFCVVVNEAGFGTASADLYVTPRIIEHPMNRDYFSGSSPASLTCLAVSHPSPGYRWEKLGSSNEYMEVAGDESTLNLGPVSYSTNGFYRCVAFINLTNILNETVSNVATVTGI